MNEEFHEIMSFGYFLIHIKVHTIGANEGYFSEAYLITKSTKN